MIIEDELYFVIKSYNFKTLKYSIIIIMLHVFAITTYRIFLLYDV